MDIDKIVEDRLVADAPFQTRVASLSDEDKETETTKRRKEILNEEFQKREKNYTDQKTRAENAETERDTLKKDPRLVTKTTENAEVPLSYEEITALQGAKVHPEYVKAAQVAAKALGKTLVEALKDPILVGQIERDNEVRASANVIETGRPRPGAGAESDQEVLDKARGKNGQIEIPAPGSEAATKLFNARRKNMFPQSRR